MILDLVGAHRLIEAAHADGAGRFVMVGGGVPIVAEGRIVGGVGVSGASAEDDAACAEAGRQAWV